MPIACKKNRLDNLKKLRQQKELPTPIEKIYKFISILTALQKISTAFGKGTSYNAFAHFYIDDYKFESI